MEKLMTTFAKTKQDIIKDALKKAEQAATLEKPPAKSQSSQTKKQRSPRPTKVSSLPWQKSNQQLMTAFHESCDALRELITTRFSTFSTIVSQKQSLKVDTFKEDLLQYVTEHRHLKHLRSTPSVDKTTTEQPWQKHEVDFSPEFQQSCDELENLIKTGFEQLFKVISQKNLKAFKILKEDLLNDLNAFHRALKPRLALPVQTEERQEEYKVIPSGSTSAAAEPEVVVPTATSS